MYSVPFRVPGRILHTSSQCVPLGYGGSDVFVGKAPLVLLVSCTQDVLGFENQYVGYVDIWY